MMTHIERPFIWDEKLLRSGEKQLSLSQDSCKTLFRTFLSVDRINPVSCLAREIWRAKVFFVENGYFAFQKTQNNFLDFWSIFMVGVSKMFYVIRRIHFLYFVLSLSVIQGTMKIWITLPKMLKTHNLIFLKELYLLPQVQKFLHKHAKGWVYDTFWLKKFLSKNNH